MSGFANPDILWSPETLSEQLGEPGLSVIDTRPAEMFATGHIPGARHFDPYFVNCDDTDPAPLRSFTRMWSDILAWRGVSESDTIVFYGAFTDMCAARCWWFVEYLGHKDVHVLDGGIAGWEAAGHVLTTDAEPPKPAKFKYETAFETVATYAGVLDAIDNPDWVILDNRSQAEYEGTDERARNNGAIPSCKHLNWVDLYDDDGRMKPADQLREAFESRGATPDKNIILYCNTGYRSAHAYMALRLLGYPNLRNYVGSWQEWGNRDGMPIWKPV